MVNGRGNRLFIATRPSGRMSVLVDGDGGVVEIGLDRPEAKSHIGEIHLGRVLRVEKGLDAAFVELGLERPALLPLADHAERLGEGDPVLVQVRRDARDGKGAKVTGRPVLAGLHVVYDPSRPGVQLSQRAAEPAAADRVAAAVRALATAEDGFVVRSTAGAASPDVVAAEAVRLRATWQALQARRLTAKPPACLHRDDAVVTLLRDVGPVEEIVIDSRGGADALRARLEGAQPELAPLVTCLSARDWVPSLAEIDEEIAAALEPEVPLAGGGSLLIEPGRTLTAIDVNSGGIAGDGVGRRSGERRLLDTNLAAAAEIARQLRLRNLGGIVVIDFIDLTAAADRARVVEALQAATAGDPAPCWIGKMSRLGLVEMSRRRRGASLAEILTGPCGACGGGGRVPLAARETRGDSA